MISITHNKTEIIANGTQTSFVFTFDFMDPTTIQLWITSPGAVSGTKIDPQLYTINTDTKTLEYPVQPAIPVEQGTLVTIIRVVDLVQLTELINQGRLQADRIEDMVDYLTLAVQQINEIAGRALTIPLGSHTSSENIWETIIDLRNELVAAVAAAENSVALSKEARELAEAAKQAAIEAAERAENAASIVETGVPTGGTAGQVLTKNSDTDNDMSWADVDAPTVEEFNNALALKANTTDLDAIKNIINSQVSNVGQILNFATLTPPTGWLLCDGSAYSTTDYAELYAVIGSTFGANATAGTFNVPDMRGLFVRGLDNRSTGATDPSAPRNMANTQGFAQQNITGNFTTRRGGNYSFGGTTAQRDNILSSAGSISHTTEAATTVTAENVPNWYVSNGTSGVHRVSLNASAQIQTAAEVRPVNRAFPYYIRAVQGSEIIDVSATLDDVKALVTQAQQAVTDAQAQLSLVEAAGENALTQIETARATAITSLNNASTSLLSSIVTEGNAQLNAIQTAANSGTSYINTAITTAQATLHSYVTSASTYASNASASADRAEAAAEIAGSGLPTGGSTGQVLTKNSDSDLDVKWADSTAVELEGGTTGQFLIKASDTNLDVEWSTAYTVPSGGATGYVLQKTSATNGDTSWLDLNGTISTAILNNSKVQTIASVSGATTISAANGEVVTIQSVTASTTFTLTASVGTGYSQVLTIGIYNGGTYTLTFNNTYWEGGTAPTFVTSGLDILTFVTVDGTTWFGLRSGTFYPGA